MYSTIALGVESEKEMVKMKGECEWGAEKNDGVSFGYDKHVYCHSAVYSCFLVPIFLHSCRSFTV